MSSGEFASGAKYLSELPAMKSFGLKLGFDAIATTEPVRASSTTTAPESPGSSCAVGVDRGTRALHALGQRLLGDLLDGEVDGEADVVSRLGLLHLDHVDGAALVVDLDLVPPRLPRSSVSNIFSMPLLPMVSRGRYPSFGCESRSSWLTSRCSRGCRRPGRPSGLPLRGPRHRHLGEVGAVLGHVDRLRERDVLRHRHRLERLVVGVVDQLVDVGCGHRAVGC